VPRFSANLGFLWCELPLPDAIRAAAEAGFDAVECHFPYEVPPGEVRAALSATGLPMLGINTRPGGTQGLAAIPGGEAEARAAIDEALAYAAAIEARAVHVMAGRVRGEEARRAYLANLEHAVRAAEPLGLTILIEALNPWDAPGYHIGDSTEAAEVIETLAAPNLKIMFDCYHVGRTERDVIGRFRALLPLIGHIQFAAVPDRGPPDHGAVDYAAVFSAIDASGWTRPLGAEYRPDGPTEASLGWMRSLGSG
jgi:hydroxypyruvate isomerase